MISTSMLWIIAGYSAMNLGAYIGISGIEPGKDKKSKRPAFVNPLLKILFGPAFLAKYLFPTVGSTSWNKRRAKKIAKQQEKVLEKTKETDFKKLSQKKTQELEKLLAEGNYAEVIHKLNPSINKEASKVYADQLKLWMKRFRIDAKNITLDAMQKMFQDLETVSFTSLDGNSYSINAKNLIERHVERSEYEYNTREKFRELDGSFKKNKNLSKEEKKGIKDLLNKSWETYLDNKLYFNDIESDLEKIVSDENLSEEERKELINKLNSRVNRLETLETQMKDYTDNQATINMLRGKEKLDNIENTLVEVQDRMYNEAKDLVENYTNSVVEKDFKDLDESIDGFIKRTSSEQYKNNIEILRNLVLSNQFREATKDMTPEQIEEELKKDEWKDLVDKKLLDDPRFAKEVYDYLNKPEVATQVKEIIDDDKDLNKLVEKAVEEVKNIETPTVEPTSLNQDVTLEQPIQQTIPGLEPEVEQPIEEVITPEVDNPVNEETIIPDNDNIVNEEVEEKPIIEENNIVRTRTRSFTDELNDIENQGRDDNEVIETIVDNEIVEEVEDVQDKEFEEAKAKAKEEITNVSTDGLMDEYKTYVENRKKVAIDLLDGKKVDGLELRTVEDVNNLVSSFKDGLALVQHKDKSIKAVQAFNSENYGNSAKVEELKNTTIANIKDSTDISAIDGYLLALDADIRELAANEELEKEQLANAKEETLTYLKNINPELYENEEEVKSKVDNAIRAIESESVTTSVEDVNAIKKDVEETLLTYRTKEEVEKEKLSQVKEEALKVVEEVNPEDYGDSAKVQELKAEAKKLINEATSIDLVEEFVTSFKDNVEMIKNEEQQKKDELAKAKTDAIWNLENKVRDEYREEEREKLQNIINTTIENINKEEVDSVDKINVLVEKAENDISNLKPASEYEREEKEQEEKNKKGLKDILENYVTDFSNYREEQQELIRKYIAEGQEKIDQCESGIDAYGYCEAYKKKIDEVPTKQQLEEQELAVAKEAAIKELEVIDATLYVEEDKVRDLVNKAIEAINNSDLVKTVADVDGIKNNLFEELKSYQTKEQHLEEVKLNAVNELGGFRSADTYSEDKQKVLRETIDAYTNKINGAKDEEEVAKLVEEGKAEIEKIVTLEQEKAQQLVAKKEEITNYLNSVDSKLYVDEAGVVELAKKALEELAKEETNTVELAEQVKVNFEKNLEGFKTKEQAAKELDEAKGKAAKEIETKNKNVKMFTPGCGVDMADAVAKAKGDLKDVKSIEEIESILAAFNVSFEEIVNKDNQMKKDFEDTKKNIEEEVGKVNLADYREEEQVQVKELKAKLSQAIKEATLANALTRAKKEFDIALKNVKTKAQYEQEEKEKAERELKEAKEKVVEELNKVDSKLYVDEAGVTNLVKEAIATLDKEGTNTLEAVAKVKEDFYKSLEGFKTKEQAAKELDEAKGKALEEIAAKNKDVKVFTPGCGVDMADAVAKAKGDLADAKTLEEVEKILAIFNTSADEIVKKDAKLKEKFEANKAKAISEIEEVNLANYREEEQKEISELKKKFYIAIEDASLSNDLTRAVREFKQDLSKLKTKAKYEQEEKEKAEKELKEAKDNALKEVRESEKNNKMFTPGCGIDLTNAIAKAKGDLADAKSKEEVENILVSYKETLKVIVEKDAKLKAEFEEKQREAKEKINAVQSIKYRDKEAKELESLKEKTNKAIDGSKLTSDIRKAMLEFTNKVSELKTAEQYLQEEKLALDKYKADSLVKLQKAKDKYYNDLKTYKGTSTIKHNKAVEEVNSFNVYEEGDLEKAKKNIDKVVADFEATMETLKQKADTNIATTREIEVDGVKFRVIAKNGAVKDKTQITIKVIGGDTKLTASVPEIKDLNSEEAKQKIIEEARKHRDLFYNKTEGLSK